ncbi:MAG TPA: BMP family ABC transporter substrate-binding protein [Actinomycetota bacterium]|nr:BMP family ABC transporter substrate-binding protein [Actinomycetota bacterium]
MQKWFRTLVLPIVALALVASACSSDEPEDSGDSGGNEDCTSEVRVGIALDVGGLGDKSFNDAAKAGLDQAIADGQVCEENANFVEANNTGSNRDANIEALADEGYDLVIGVGFAFSEGVAAIAADYPDVNFAVVDGFATFLPDAKGLTNVADLTFKEQEGSYLVGAAAALKCQCDTIGFLGGQEGTGLIEKFEAGYTAGAKAVNPDIDVLVEYIGDDTTAFVNDVKGEALSAKMYDGGAEIVYHAAGLSGAGLFRAAVDANKLAIGVDSDQYLTAAPEEQPLILTSMLKRVDTAVYDAIEQTADEAFKGGFQVFGLDVEGVDFSTSNEEELTSDIVERMDEFKEQIISGEIVVPEEPENA